MCPYEVLGWWTVQRQDGTVQDPQFIVAACYVCSAAMNAVDQPGEYQGQQRSHVANLSSIRGNHGEMRRIELFVSWA